MGIGTIFKKRPGDLTTGKKFKSANAENGGQREAPNLEEAGETMTFEKFIPRRNNLPYLRVSSVNVSLSKAVIELLKETKRVDVYFDKEADLIKLEPSENGTAIIHRSAKNSLIPVLLSKKMPKKRYFRIDNLTFKGESLEEKP